MNRRHAIKILGSGGLALYLNACSSTSGKTKNILQPAVMGISPIDRTIAEIAPRKYFADDPAIAHRILWDKAGFISAVGAKLPAPTEHRDVTIIGGGMSGLCSAYFLRNHSPLVLEQADRFGGNAKGQSWRGIDYSIGAAYLMQPEEESEIEYLLYELGINTKSSPEPESKPFELGGKLHEDFWSGKTSAHGNAQFKLLKSYLESFGSDPDILFPDIPARDSEMRLMLKKWTQCPSGNCCLK